MSTILRDNFRKEMEDELVESTHLGMKKGEAWKPIFHQKKTDKMRVEKGTHVHPPYIGVTEEGAALNRYTTKKGFYSYVVPLWYTGEQKVTHQFMKHCRYEEIKKDSFGFGMAIQRNRLRKACEILVNGFASVTSPDGKPLFYDAHTLAATSLKTGDNLITSGWSTDALDEAVTLLLNTPDENGEPLNYDCDHLRVICVPSNVNQVLKSLGSTYVAEDMNNGINVFHESYGHYGVSVVCLPMLEAIADASWAKKQFYVQAVDYHELEFYEAEAPDMWTVNDQNSLDVLFQCLDAFGFLIGDWRFVVGSKGLG